MRTLWFLGFALLLTLAPAPARAKDGPSDAVPFPHLGILPKAETGAMRLLEKHPACDGRGIVVAIFDTGVDPGAAGLQVTSDGKPKIVDVIDGSGSGDVDTSTVREAKDGKLEALSGRTVTLPKWNNPTGKWHLGVKRAYDLYPPGLVARLKKKRRKAWDEHHRQALVAARKALAAVDAAPKASATKKDTKKGAKKGADKKDASKKDEKAPASPRKKELRRRLAQLEALGASYKDPGPVLDVFAFHDGKHWRAAIDTDEDGLLDDEKAMANYRVAREWSTFSAEDLLNFAVNVYDDGKLVSVVVDVGAHGTHVAGIVAANFPDRPELNGLAPGAQIVSVKIGDTRMGSSSMGTGEARGLAAVLRNKCHLINKSYGGASASPNRTRMDKLYHDIVRKHGVIFVSSAGNDGPCLSTVGSPGGTNDALFGVGAYVSPAMMKAQFALRKSVPGTHFTWSARGPTLDGALGVDFSAPGGAIAPVPTWSLEGLTQMNGTSMSAPNLCGNIALLLSAMKKEGIASSPQRIRRALANTAIDIPTLTPFGRGAGLIQVDRALEYVRTHRDRPDEDVRYNVQVLSDPGGRGIYLREPHDVARPREFRVRVEPKLHEDADHRRRVALDQRIRLVATQPWIDVADHLLLVHGGRRFDVRVDPTAIAAGGAHYGEVHGLDSSAPERGPLFRIPVTVVRPEAPQEPRGVQWKWKHQMRPGDVLRHFVVPPPGATWADVRIRAGKQTTSKLFVLQTVQLLPGRSFKDHYLDRYMRMDEDEDAVFSFDVEGGRTLEVAIAQYWSSLDEGACDVELTFHGIVPEPREVLLTSGMTLRGVDVSAPLARTRVEPSASLVTLRKMLPPVDATIRALLPARDALPRKRLGHELVLRYEFEMKAKARIRPRGPLELADPFWEDWDSGLWVLLDENQRPVAQGPMWEDKSAAVGKGTYTLLVHMRHDDPARMKPWKKAAMALDIKLGDKIDLDVHADFRAREGIGRPEFAPGERRRLWVMAPSSGALPKLAAPGDLLIGKIHFGEERTGRRGAGRRPGGWPVTVVVAPKGKAKDDEDDDEEDDDEDPKPTWQEALRDAKVEQLAALRKAKEVRAFEVLAAEILRAHPNHLPVLVERLKMLDGKGPPHEGGSARVLEAAARILAAIDRKEVAAYFGVKREDLKGAARREFEATSKQRDALREALFRITRIMKSNEDSFLRSYDQLRMWVDIDDERYRPLTLHRARIKKEWGRALELVDTLIDEAPTKREHYEARIELIEKLGWQHLLDAERAWLPLRFPKGKQVF